MSSAIYRTDDPDLKSIEPGALYSTHAPCTGEPWVLYKISDTCGVTSIEPLDVPDGWDDAYEYVMAGEPIWPRLTRLAMDAYLAHANLEIAVVPIVDDETVSGSRTLLYRFTWPY